MPQVGDIKRGREIGKTTTKSMSSQLFIWYGCELCGAERWVALNKGVCFS